MKYLFICKGNVGRSQMAEAFCNSFVGKQLAWSAGTLAFTPAKYGNPTDDIIQVMKEKNIDVSRAKVKTVTEEMIDRSEHVIVLCKKDECPAFVQKSEKVVYWESITDPFSLEIADVKSIRDNIEKRVKELLQLQI